MNRLINAEPPVLVLAGRISGACDVDIVLIIALVVTSLVVTVSSGIIEQRKNR
jgi:hypothetical protein